MNHPLPQYAEVRWTGAKEGSWSASGLAKILAFEPERPLFPDGKPATRKSPPLGPAYLIQLHHNGLTVWVGVRDVEEPN